MGGQAQPTSLDPRDLAIVHRLAPKLRSDGLFFVGLDVIGGKLTEVNVTSPTGLQELARFTDSQPASRVLEWIECRAALLKTYLYWWLKFVVCLIELCRSWVQQSSSATPTAVRS